MNIEKVKNETLKEFEHAFNGLSSQGLVDRTASALSSISKKYSEVTKKPLDCELLHNCLMEAKIEKVKSLIKQQIAGMKYEQLLAMEIMNEKYAVELYSELADAAITNNDMPTLNACVNNLINWGAKEKVEQIKGMIDGNETTRQEEGAATLST